MIREFAHNGGTVFLTSHIMSDVDELCDRVAFITDGKIEEIDSPRNLKINDGQGTVPVEYNKENQTQVRQFTMDEIKTDAFAELMRTKEIETIHSGETTLEEIFIQVTGVKLHGED